ncbi:hypothetical protein [Robiginitalea sp.]|uniref:hypothetical protein n=1 Tax=Robiginitalea sp. TaxID=1902411 RepID=UPI003C4471D1
MKRITQLPYILLGLILISQSTEAQLLKKLRQKVEAATEQVIVNKTAEIAAKQTEKAMDKMLNSTMGGKNAEGLPTEPGSASDLPDSYDFTWRYGMRFEASKASENMDMTYFFKPDAAYWGVEFTQEVSMFMVYDNGQNQMAIFSNVKGESFVSVTKFPEVGTTDEDTMDFDDFTMTELPPKEVLGYQCKGFRFENSTHNYTTYVTFEVPVSFSDIYGRSDKLPKGFNVDWLKDGDNEGLMMEMIMEDKKSPKNNMKMTCVLLEENPYQLKKSDYKSLY